MKSSILMLLILSATSAVYATPQKPPRLILQITVDALRGDLPYRYQRVFGDAGFRYLLEQGINYTDANYQHANTETIVGHASLATGAPPSVHGMIANVWYDRQQDRYVYNIEDARYHLLTAGADVNKSTEIDSTQKAARVDGRSPRNFLSSTFSDELAVHTAGRAKIFAVSVKDRGAVSLAGQSGKAFWFSKATGNFVTSNYYYDHYPAWVDAWNARDPASAYANKAWELLYPSERYLFGDADQHQYEVEFAGFGQSFPHRYGERDDKYFTTKLTLSPAGDELTLDFASTLLDHEQLGQDDIPDYLAISFSSTDYVGHIFGASSLESEDNLARLDRTLAKLFAMIDTRVGLDNTLIVLSADHGQPEVPGFLHELGFENPRYFDFKGLDRAPALAALKQRFGIGGELIESYYHPYLYLKQDTIKALGLDQAEVERAVATELLKFKGIADAIPSSALRSASLSDTPLNRSVLNNYHPSRSGDIYVVLEPNVFINDFDGLAVASTHGSPWRYDSYVPVIFAGAGLQPVRVSRPVTPYDIAPTLADILRIKPPSGATGLPLPEVSAALAGVL